jgi:hypothetical protein
MMKREINFSSIFRRKDGQQPIPSEPAVNAALVQQLAQRQITLKEGQLTPITEEAPPLDWATVSGQVTLLASTVDGILEGRARIRAEHLKRLTPPPVGAEVPDATEYALSLAALIPQIADLLQTAVPESDPSTETGPSRLADFETPFTALAKEDSIKFAGAGAPEQFGQAAAVQNTAAQKLKPPPIEPREPPDRVSAPTEQFPPERAPEEAPVDAEADSLRRRPGDDPARRGLERLHEIFMVSEPLDGRRVALLLRQFPEVTGALILLEGGAVLGGQLPDALNLEAALQAPEVMAHFIRFIVELESGQKVNSHLITVNSATTISLARSGQVVLLVSHQKRKLPPGLAQRLTETAEALNLIYANSCS